MQFTYTAKTSAGEIQTGQITAADMAAVRKALREQKLFISHDTATDPRTRLWLSSDAVPHGCAAAPLINNGESVGVLFFFFGLRLGRDYSGASQLVPYFVTCLAALVLLSP